MTPFTTTRRVEFRDTDAAGIMHFAAFFPLMESVEHDFLRTLGLSVMDSDATGKITWPRVNAQCDFKAAVNFEDVLTIALRISRLGNKSVTYQFDVRRDEDEIAKGSMTVVCCRLEAGKPLVSISIPPAIADKLRPYVA